MFRKSHIFSVRGGCSRANTLSNTHARLWESFVNEEKCQSTNGTCLSSLTALTSHLIRFHWMAKICSFYHICQVEPVWQQTGGDAINFKIKIKTETVPFRRKSVHFRVKLTEIISCIDQRPKSVDPSSGADRKFRKSSRRFTAPTIDSNRSSIFSPMMGGDTGHC